MDLSTTYLGLKLEHPLMVGASPFTKDLDKARRLEDAGTSAITMNSLFEEQIEAEQEATTRDVDAHMESFGEATSYLPNPENFALGPDAYLEQLRKIKEAVHVPVIGSLNGSSLGGWLDFASLIEQAGADALELNAYALAADFSESSEIVEKKVVDLVREVKKTIKIPVTVKLSPFYSSLSNFSKHLENAGADGLVLFNRFYQPDIDTEELEVVRSLQLSSSSELLLRLRWLAILSDRVNATLGITGGVHTGQDAIKAIMAGAHGVQLVSALLLHGPKKLQAIRQEMVNWLEEHEYKSVEQMRGSLSHAKCPNPKAFERLNYIEILQTWE